MDVFFFLFMFTIIAPYVFYAWVYMFPKQFLRVGKPVLFKIVGYGFKPLQFFFAFLCTKTTGVSWNSLCFGLILIFLGQLLNMSFNSRLGQSRVYYGVELGVEEFKLYTGFPFDIGHSQYKGCILCILGFLLAFKPSKLLIQGSIVWIVCYLLLSIVESYPYGLLENKLTNNSENKSKTH